MRGNYGSIGGESISSYDTPLIRAVVESWFPGLVTDPRFMVSSRDDPDHNCIALAVEDPSQWWWPTIPHPPTRVGLHWPLTVPPEATIPAFVELFEQRGYSQTSDSRQKWGTTLVAIYVNPATGRPTHAARQQPYGSWLSKLGPQWDIEHGSPATVEGARYGSVTVYMR